MEASTCNHGAGLEERQKPLEIPSRRLLASPEESRAQWQRRRRKQRPRHHAESETAEMEAKAKAAMQWEEDWTVEYSWTQLRFDRPPRRLTVKLITLEQLN